MFGAIARRYDLNNRLHSFGRDVAWRRAAVRAAELTPTSEVLDVACGTGDLSGELAEAGVAKVVGVDFSSPMLEIAKSKAVRLRDPGRVEYRLGDAMALDFPDASFDVVTISFGLRNVAAPPRAIREFRRVLRPRGRLVILEFSQPRNRLLRWGNRFYTEWVMPRTATLIAGDRSGAYRYLPRSVQTFPEPAVLGSWITEAGFRDLRQRPLTFGVCTLHVGVADPAIPPQPRTA